MGSSDVSAGDTILASQQNDLRDDVIDQVTTKGDLMVATGADTMIRLAVGANDSALIADSGESSGLKYATVVTQALATAGTSTAVASWSPLRVKQAIDGLAGGGGLVEIGSATASSSASLTVTGLSDTYEMYLITLANIEPETDAVSAFLRIGDSSGVDTGASDYTWNDQKTTTGATGATGSFDASDSQIVIGSTIGNNSERVFNATVWMGRDPGAAARTVCHGASSSYNATSGDTEGMTFMGGRKAAIDMDRINFLFSSGDIATGEMTVYGLKFS